MVQLFDEELYKYYLAFDSAIFSQNLSFCLIFSAISIHSAPPKTAAATSCLEIRDGRIPLNSRK